MKEQLIEEQGTYDLFDVYPTSAIDQIKALNREQIKSTATLVAKNRNAKFSDVLKALDLLYRIDKDESESNKTDNEPMRIDIRIRESNSSIVNEDDDD